MVQFGKKSGSERGKKHNKKPSESGRAIGRRASTARPVEAVLRKRMFDTPASPKAGSK